MPGSGNDFRVKKILFLLFSLFLTYQSYKLVETLWHAQPKELGWSLHLVFAVLINLFVTGIFAFPGFVLSTNQLLPEKYYAIGKPGRLNQVSRVLQINSYKKFLLFIFWGKENNRKRYFNGSRSGLEHFDYQTRQSEFGHIAAGAVVQVVTFAIAIKGHLLFALLSTTINLIFNIYPALLQRVHRMQLNRIKLRMNSKSLKI